MLVKIWLNFFNIFIHISSWSSKTAKTIYNTDFYPCTPENIPQFHGEVTPLEESTYIDYV